MKTNFDGYFCNSDRYGIPRFQQFSIVASILATYYRHTLILKQVASQSKIHDVINCPTIFVFVVFLFAHNSCVLLLVVLRLHGGMQSPHLQHTHCPTGQPTPLDTHKGLPTRFRHFESLLLFGAKWVAHIPMIHHRGFSSRDLLRPGVKNYCRPIAVNNLWGDMFPGSFRTYFRVLHLSPNITSRLESASHPHLCI